MRRRNLFNNKEQDMKLVDLPAESKPIGLRWMFKIKRNFDESTNKFKARLVAEWYIQRPIIDFDEIFALVARIETIQITLL